MNDESEAKRRQHQSVARAPGRATLPPVLVEQLLSSMDVQIEAFAVCRLGRNTALTIPGRVQLKMIYVLTGSVNLSVQGSAPLALTAGSIVLIPKERAQVLAGTGRIEHRFDAGEVRQNGAHDLMNLNAFVGSSPDVQVLCGWLMMGLAAEFSSFDGLLDPISANLDSSAFVRSAFETMIDETRFRTAGSRTLANTLMKACMVELFRHGLDRPEPDAGSPAIFLKPGLGRAVSAILGHPASSHTVASLARIAGMSRSAFAKAFEATLGVTPIEFLARARLARARDRILASDDSIATIAESVGFASRSHFSSRFRERYGEGPTAFRKRLTADPRVLQPAVRQHGGNDGPT